MSFSSVVMDARLRQVSDARTTRCKGLLGERERRLAAAPRTSVPYRRSSLSACAWRSQASRRRREQRPGHRAPPSRPRSPQKPQAPPRSPCRSPAPGPFPRNVIDDQEGDLPRDPFGRIASCRLRQLVSSSAWQEREARDGGIAGTGARSPAERPRVVGCGGRERSGDRKLAHFARLLAVRRWPQISIGAPGGSKRLGRRLCSTYAGPRSDRDR